MSQLLKLDPPRTIIAFTGSAGSGKDTAANYFISMYDYHRVAFADPVRDALYALNPLVCLEQAITTNSAIYERVATIVDKLGWHEAKKNPEIRALLQRIGTEAGWQIHGKNLWINNLISRINELPADAKIVITDLRFPNELTWLNSLRYDPDNSVTTVAITRPGNESRLTAGPDGTAAHISEQGDLDTDSLIYNGGTVEDLHTLLSQLIERGIHSNKEDFDPDVSPSSEPVTVDLGYFNVDNHPLNNHDV